MSRTNNMRAVNIRWQLLATVSALALTASAYTASEALAADGDTNRPLIWIELGGQLSKLDDAVEPFTPSFMTDVTSPNLLSALNVERQPSYAFDTNGKISFQPDNSNWAFSASVRFGRSQAIEHRHTQSKNTPIKEIISFPSYPNYDRNLLKYPARYVRFADGQSQQSERHLILDFQAGKDVGLGMFGGSGSSVFSAGIRYAEFNSKANVSLGVVPDLQYPTHLSGIGFAEVFSNIIFYIPPSFHNFAAQMASERSFKGLGPALSWNASMPFAGNAESGELTLDWGANASLLFGRQKAKGQTQTTVRTPQAHLWNNKAVPHYNGAYVGYFFGGSGFPAAVHTAPGTFNRDRSVTVPNLGGSVGISFRYADAKVSFGYKADVFFNAIDGGIDTRKSENRGFFGPYASISIGLGD